MKQEQTKIPKGYKGFFIDNILIYTYKEVKG